MTTFIIQTLGDKPDIRVTVDKYGYVKIGDAELSSDDIQIIANLSMSQRVKHFTTERG